MPRYYRRSRLRRWRRWGRAYRSRTLRRRYRRPTVVSSRSRLRVKIPVVQNIQVRIPAGSLYSYMASIFPWETTGNRQAQGTNAITPSGTQMSLGAVDNPIFQSYADLFDEVKFDGCSATITCTEPIAPGANYTGLLLGTAIDRSITRDEDVPTVDIAKNSASWYGKIAVNNSIPRIRRSIWASDAQERSNFVDSDYTSNPVVGNTYLKVWSTNSGTSNYFRPAIRFGVQAIAAPAVDQVSNYLIQVNFYFTFRNPKGASTSTSSKAVEIALKQAALPTHIKEAQISESDFLNDQQTLLDEDTRI